MKTIYYAPLAIGIGAAGWYIGLPVVFDVLAGIIVVVIIEKVLPRIFKNDSESK
jgi:zinc transporter ZupT